MKIHTRRPRRKIRQRKHAHRSSHRHPMIPRHTPRPLRVQAEVLEGDLGLFGEEEDGHGEEEQVAGDVVSSAYARDLGPGVGGEDEGRCEEVRVGLRVHHRSVIAQMFRYRHERTTREMEYALPAQ